MIRHRIMIITDQPMSRAMLDAILRTEPDFEAFISSDPVEARKALAGVDLIVLDLAVAPVDLYRICGEIKAYSFSSSVPLLLLTSHSGPSHVDRSRALDSGADDVVGKPFHRSELILRIRSLLRLKTLFDELQEVEAILLSLAKSVESKINYTQSHGQRVADYCAMIGREIGLGRDDLRILRRAALIHDIGKAAIPDLILQKPEKLTADEADRLRKQSALTVDANLWSALTPVIVPIIRHHTERFDGTGYPDKLRGEQIPLGARILAIANSYDSMITQRPYRAALSAERARQQLQLGAGTEWDGTILEVFMVVLDQFDKLNTYLNLENANSDPN